VRVQPSPPSAVLAALRPPAPAAPSNCACGVNHKQRVSSCTRHRCSCSFVRRNGGAVVASPLSPFSPTELVPGAHLEIGGPSAPQRSAHSDSVAGGSSPIPPCRVLFPFQARGCRASLVARGSGAICCVRAWCGRCGAGGRVVRRAAQRDAPMVRGASVSQRQKAGKAC